MKALIVCESIHMGSTKKIAEAMGRALNADVKQPREVNPEKIAEYDLIGFGSGIYDSTFHPSIFKLADKLPSLEGKKVFTFSTSGIIYKEAHAKIKRKLEEKGAVVSGDFYCRGLNKNSFLKYFGGMNKGRPNSHDLGKAQAFATSMSI